MTAESKQAFYEEFTTYLSTIDDLACIHQKMTNQSCAKLYQGWTIDSKSNPTAIAAIFRKRTGKQSTCSGAVIPRSHLDQTGLKPMLTCQEFVDAPVPKKWGREQEIVQEKSAVCHKAADHQNPERGHATSDGSPEESSEESSEESAEKSGKKRAAANATPDKRGNSVKRTPGGGKKRSTEEISGTSRGADAAGKSTKRAKKSSATPLAGDTSKNLIDPAEFDSIIAVVRNQLFNDSVPKEEYIKLQQENSKLVSECKRVEDLAASRQAALEEYASLLSRMNAVTKPK